MDRSPAENKCGFNLWEGNTIGKRKLSMSCEVLYCGEAQSAGESTSGSEPALLLVICLLSHTWQVMHVLALWSRWLALPGEIWRHF